MKIFFLTLVSSFIFSNIFAVEKNELAGPLATKVLESENAILIRVDWSGSKIIQEFFEKNKIDSKKFECREWSEDESNDATSCLLRWGAKGFEDLNLKDSDLINESAGFKNDGSAAVFIEDNSLNIRMRSGAAAKILKLMEPNYIKIPEMSFQNAEMYCAKLFSKKFYPYVSCRFIFNANGNFKANPPAEKK